MKLGRPRKLSQHKERVMLEEYRMSQYFSRKRIRERYGLTEPGFSEYIRRAYNEGRL